MKGAISSPVSGAMQETFGCAVMNRFDQLLDDEADPFDILREVEEEQKKKKDEPKKSGTASKSGRRESQKDRKVVTVPGGEGNDEVARNTAGQKRPPRSGMQMGQNENRGTEAKVERTERRVVFRERRPNEVEAPEEYSVEKPSDRFDRPMRGRWGGRGAMRGRGGSGGFQRNFDGFDQRGKREFERHSGSDRMGMRPDEKRGGSGPHNWGSVKDDMSDIEHVAPTEEAAENEEAQEAPGDAENRGIEGEGEQPEEGPMEMTLDEWKALQQQNRPKKDFNIRKPESSVPTKAVVIHKSKYVDDLKGETDEDEDDHHVFRRPANDITSKLDINFGSLARPGRGGRGGRGSRGRGGPPPTTRPDVPPRSVVDQGFAPNPDDPEDFPALV
ncbi:intracellular hyaluronan-binding protein 4-like isoform X1 [Polyodon spathula]|uniref:intracellular hyaluronan-binding protein 4-like isoform X1 n=1 Tax=Polyodon spathula TaxID=7913 RepID=UPI001B7E8A8F|nr:intracellular hyaluronan-binding protein 4-like isoform X1 [Polyodon spathula]